MKFVLSPHQWRIQDFSLGGPVPTCWGDLRHGCFLVKMNAKMKELGLIGGGGALTAPLDPPMQRVNFRDFFLIRNLLQEANYQFAPDIIIAIVKLVPRAFCKGDIYL